ncbi:hypothetical protein F8M41_020951 [Gigaspora margarita]|uniref:Uncharacterized protein n=1 Tax=Gigaspora margarita TaxID=4874 RepID=A0A8H4EJA4_GIGMA|nr:hypothetical protein F8M41_020951 [Gigaspora margarita]
MCEIIALFQYNDLLIKSLNSQQELSQYTQPLLNDDILISNSQGSLARFIQQDLPMLDVLFLNSQQELSQYTQPLLNDNILTSNSQGSLAQFVQQDLPMLDMLAVDSIENNDNITKIDQ